MATGLNMGLRQKLGIDRKVLSARLNRARVTLAQRLMERQRVVPIRRARSQS